MNNEHQDDPKDEAPLGSWKEIAAYLQRDVRTLMRWEKYERLPIHRHHHLSRSSVYAYRHELETWRAGRKLDPEFPPLWRRPLPSAALALVLMLTLLSAGGSGRLPKVEAADRIAMRQVWSGPGVDSYGAPSPDGRYLSFTDWSNGDLAIRDLATGQNRRLTHKEGGWDNWHEYAESSVISPDGKRVAFEWYNPKDHGELRIVNVDGSDERVLYRTEHPYDVIEPADWSRDGQLILARHTVEEGPYKLHRIVTVSVADGSLTVLRVLDWRSPEEMRFSPDGRFVVYDFAEKSVQDSDIFVLSLSGGHVTPLVQHPAQDRLAGWTPDGRWVLFLSDRTGSWGMWMVPVSDGRAEGSPVAVKRDTGPIKPMGFTETGAFYYGIGDEGLNIYTSTPSGGTPTLLVNQFLGSNVAPSWSPDGEQIAYIRRSQSPRAKICIRTLDTGAEREYSPDLAWFLAPLLWSPDGRSLLVRGKGSDGRTGSYGIDLATGRVAPVLLEPRAGVPFLARWSADGKAVYYVESLADESKRVSKRVVRRDLATGRDETVSLPPEGISLTRFVYPSPDGRHLALWVNREGQGRVAVMSAEGAGVRELTGPWGDTQPASITWTPDSRQILFLRQEGTLTQVTRSELWSIPAEGGEPARLGFSTKGGPGRFSIHPDGKRLVFSLSEHATREIWVLENLLPVAPSAPR